MTETWSRSAPEDRTLSYDLGGSVIKTTGGGPQVDTALTSATNYMVPSTVTPNGQSNLASSAQWDSVLRLTSSMTGAGFNPI